MKKIVLITLTMFIELCLSKVTFAYQTSILESYESTSSTGYCEIRTSVYLNKIFDLKNISVKFTQDDQYYIFHVTGNTTVNIYKDFARTTIVSGGGGIAPLLYSKPNFGDGMYIVENDKTPFISFTAGNLYTNVSVSILNQLVESYSFKYYQHSNGTTSNEQLKENNNGLKYYIGNNLRCSVAGHPPNFVGARTYPVATKNNGVGVKLLSNASSYYYTYNDVRIGDQPCADMFYGYMNVKVAIEKRYMDDYRYICFARSFLYKNSENINTTDHDCKGLSACTQTIDLKEYAHCDHEWEIKAEDRKNHSIHCKNCQWTKIMPHEFLYEYDGIKHNVCTCSYIEKVNYNFNINDDFTKEVTETFYSDSVYEKHEFKRKTGYKFKHYEVYETKLSSINNLSTVSNALNTTLVATTSVLPDNTGQMSMTYVARYDPNSFTINYSNINNKGLEVDGNSEPQKIVYDEVEYLKENLYHEGYTLKGWSKVKAGERVDLKPLQEVTNYTDEDLYELTLYPVYTTLDFKIAYNAGNNFLSDGSKYKVVSYTYYDDKEFERVKSTSTETYLQYFIDSYGNKYRAMAELKKYLDKNGLNNVTVNLFPVFGRSEYSPPTRGDDTNGPNKKKDEKKEEETITETKENDENFIIDDNDSIIYGMSDSTNDLADNEGEKTIKGAVVASLSFIRRNNVDGNKKIDKFAILQMFIRENLLFCTVSAVLLLISLIIYEILIINYYRKLKKQMIN